ncbi:MAG TPA: IS1595 family transposase [Candidatus Aminicenantes bacterium]|nr:IS1595 family transposase [Candidatus Aminicenantes bacterium]
MNIYEFFERFPDEEACVKELIKLRQDKCCGKLYLIKSRAALLCDRCMKHISLKKGTIYEKSSTPLTKWFYALYLMSQNKSGISAKQLQREIKVTYKTAWRMLNKIRGVMNDDVPLEGVIEADETFVGGMNKKRAKYYYEYDPGRKSVVFGLAERRGRVKAFHVPNVGKRTLMKVIEENVKPGTHINTDLYPAYKSLPKRGYKHSTVNHTYRFVDNGAHIQNIECFWSMLKRGLIGVYRAVSSQHLQSYVDEFAFRWNHREDAFSPLLRHALEVHQN